MKSNFSKGMLMTALVTGTVLCSSAAAFAEELQEYSLDQMVVTAQRTEKDDVATPASVKVITEKDLTQSGATNLYDGLKLAKNAGNMGYDAIISRGGTAKIIKKYIINENENRFHIDTSSDCAII